MPKADRCVPTKQTTEKTRLVKFNTNRIPKAKPLNKRLAIFTAPVTLILVFQQKKVRTILHRPKKKNIQYLSCLVQVLPESYRNKI